MTTDCTDCSKANWSYWNELDLNVGLDGWDWYLWQTYYNSTAESGANNLNMQHRYKLRSGMSIELVRSWPTMQNGPRHSCLCSCCWCPSTGRASPPTGRWTSGRLVGKLPLTPSQTILCGQTNEFQKLWWFYWGIKRKQSSQAGNSNQEEANSNNNIWSSSLPSKLLCARASLSHRWKNSRLF